MSWLSQLTSRLRRNDSPSISIPEHLADRIEKRMNEGMSSRDAGQTARREFGNAGFAEQPSREIRQWPTVESILADVRFGLRQLIQSRGFTATTVVTLALGIAVNATMFSVVSAFLMPQLPGRDPQSVVVISSVSPDASFQGDINPVSPPNYLEWSKDTRIFSAVAAAQTYRTGSLSGSDQQPAAVSYAAVSANYFTVFDVSAQLGRTFVPGEDTQGHDHVLILSDGLWKRWYGANPSIIGQTVRLNREDYVVVGVMPADFQLLGFTPQLWTPLPLARSDLTPDARKNRFLRVFARLAPGITLNAARAKSTILAQQFQQDFPEIEKHWGISVRMLGDYLVYNVGIRPALAVIMTVVGFVLLIACANVAALLLTRALGRQKELAIRMSLGASRSRIVRQLLTEGLIIAFFGGGIGLFLTYFGIRLLRAGLNFSEIIGAVPISLDARVLLFIAVISVVSAVLSSLAPAAKASRTASNTDLKGEARGATLGRTHRRLRVVLVGGEIAMALFLLIGSCLLIRGVYILDHQKLGFDRNHLLTAGVVLDNSRYADSSKQNQFVRSLTQQLQQIPGVETAAITSDLPISGPARVPIHIKGQAESRSNEQHTTADAAVTSDYFRAIGLPILSGRAFTEHDDASAPRVVIVSQEFMHTYFPDRDPLGKQIQLDVPGTPPIWSEIVGVVADVKKNSEDLPIESQVYEAYAQRPASSFSLILRSSVESNSLAISLRHVVSQFDSDLPLLRVASMEDIMNTQSSGNPLFARLLATFAMLALVLSAVGIHGLIAYSVGQRTKEIGIRLALGAKASDISRMVLRDGLKVATFGSAIGFAMALPLPNLFNSIFNGLRFGAPGVYPIVLAVTLLVALGATLGPACRATRINPTSALRNE